MLIEGLVKEIRRRRHKHERTTHAAQQQREEAAAEEQPASSSMSSQTGVMCSCHACDAVHASILKCAWISFALFSSGLCYGSNSPATHPFKRVRTKFSWVVEVEVAEVQKLALKE